MQTMRLKFFGHTFPASVQGVRSLIIHRKYETTLLVIVLIGFFALAWTGLLRHWNIGSYHFDLGNMHQAVYNTSRGRFLEMTDPVQFFQSNRLGYHFDPILALFAPFYWIYDGAEVLIIGQALILALGAIPMYFLSAKVLHNKLGGLLFATTYLLFYPMHYTQIADFHAVTLSTTFLLFMFYFGEIKRFSLAWVFIVLAWLTKENVPLVTAFFGLYHVLYKNNKRFGVAVFIASAVAFIMMIKFIIPSLRVDGTHFAAGYYTTDILTNLQRFFRRETASYVTSLLAPLGFLSLLSPVHLLISLPEWMINILSGSGNMRVIRYHYTAQLTPFILVAAVYGLRNLATLIGSKKLHVAGAGIVCAITIVFSLYHSPLFTSKYRPNTTELQVIREWQEKLADDQIKVAATGHLSPHFAGRQYFYNFLFDFAYGNQGYSDDDIRSLASHYENADFVLIKESEINDHEMVQYYYAHLLSNEAYEKVYDSDGIEVYKRKNI
jgi:uncharacterized membrane protein